MGTYLQQYALQYTKIGNAAFLTILYVPFVPIISRFILKKRIHWSIWVSVSICLVGSYYLTVGNSFEAQFADFLVVVCAIFFALQSFLQCKKFCIAIICALQKILHCNYFCGAISFALRLFLHCSSSVGFAGGGLGW